MKQVTWTLSVNILILAIQKDYWRLENIMLNKKIKVCKVCGVILEKGINCYGGNRKLLCKKHHKMADRRELKLYEH